MPGPGYTPAAPAQFTGAQPGSSGLAPWLRQGTNPLQMQGFQARAISSPQMGGQVSGGTPWYQGQLDARQQETDLLAQQKQAELLRQQQAAANVIPTTSEPVPESYEWYFNQNQGGNYGDSGSGD